MLSSRAKNLIRHQGEKMANWAQFGHFYSGVYSPFFSSGLDINVCVELFRGDSKFTLLYKL